MKLKYEIIGISNELAHILDCRRILLVDIFGIIGDEEEYRESDVPSFGMVIPLIGGDGEYLKSLIERIESYGENISIAKRIREYKDLKVLRCNLLRRYYCKRYYAYFELGSRYAEKLLNANNCRKICEPDIRKAENEILDLHYSYEETVKMLSGGVTKDLIFFGNRNNEDYYRSSIEGIEGFSCVELLPICLAGIDVKAKRLYDLPPLSCGNGGEMEDMGNGVKGEEYALPLRHVININLHIGINDFSIMDFDLSYSKRMNMFNEIHERFKYISRCNDDNLGKVKGTECEINLESRYVLDEYEQYELETTLSLFFDYLPSEYEWRILATKAFMMHMGGEYTELRYIINSYSISRGHEWIILLRLCLLDYLFSGIEIFDLRYYSDEYFDKINGKLLWEGRCKRMKEAEELRGKEASEELLSMLHPYFSIVDGII